ncbi:MAG: BrnA antitoxin family protein [Pseudomonadales bacterium]|nr:BrnA antitoxin family protein [Pseudomonadales bacterium]
MSSSKKVITLNLTTLRLSHEISEYFRATGKGWQTRLNKAFKEYVAAQQ